MESEWKIFMGVVLIPSFGFYSYVLLIKNNYKKDKSLVIEDKMANNLGGKI